MAHYVVSGPVSLEGEVPISGSKNSVLKIMAAALMVPGSVTIRRVPQITDVHLMMALLQRLGAEVKFEGAEMTIDASGELSDEAPYELVTKIRGSFQVLGPLISRLGSAKVSMPGGDAIGSRPVDMHISGLGKMGATFTSEHGYIEGKVGRLQGTRVLLEFPSVGATETLLMAAVLAEGTTTVENAAREPLVTSLDVEYLVDLTPAVGAQCTQHQGSPRSDVGCAHRGSRQTRDPPDDGVVALHPDLGPHPIQLVHEEEA